MPEEQELLLTRVFDAPPGLVFDAWTDPAQVALWWGPTGFEAPYAELDVRPGGAWRTCIRSEEHGELWSRGVYREVDRPRRLAFTFAWEEPEGVPGDEMGITVTFAAEDGGKTLMTFRQRLIGTEERRDSEAAGWSECFDKLADALAGR